MNGHSLPAEHGAPIRGVVPGQIGARSVKWLVNIRLLPEPSNSFFMQRDYKHFGPNVLPQNSASEDTVELPAAVVNAAAPMTSLNIQLAITSPSNAESNIVGIDGPLPIRTGHELMVEGFAFSGGGNAAQAVYVCLLAAYEAQTACDEYGRWASATMDPRAVPPSPLTESPSNQNWHWTLWELHVPVPDSEGNYTLIARAVDTGNQHMPETGCPIYSWRGVLNNAWFQLPLVAQHQPYSFSFSYSSF